MSHYNVAVFSHAPDDIDRLLAPFNEDVGPDSPYAVFKEDEECDFEPSKGKRGYWHNPNARWDWWEIGGHWPGFLKLKENRLGLYNHLSNEAQMEQLKQHVCDQALLADCLMTRDEARYKRALRDWELAVEGAEPADEKEKRFFSMWKPEYYLKQYGDKEKYADEIAACRTYAFVSAEGRWHETGRMGWFGLDDATRDSRNAYIVAFDEYLKQALARNLYITIVDCHI